MLPCDQNAKNAWRLTKKAQCLRSGDDDDVIETSCASRRKVLSLTRS